MPMNSQSLNNKQVIPFTIKGRYSQFTIHNSPFTIHHKKGGAGAFTIHHSQFTVHNLQLKSGAGQSPHRQIITSLHVL
jgi:hypothetical protein